MKPMNQLLTLAASLITLIAIGCASPAHTDTKSDTTPAQEIVVPPQGQAVVCFYRDKDDPWRYGGPKMWGNAYPILFGTQEIAGLNRGELFLHNVDPGEVVYSVPATPTLATSIGLLKAEPTVTPINIQAGKVYYLHMVRGNLIRVDNATGRKGANLCKPAK